MLEVLREYKISEAIDILDVKGLTRRDPINKVCTSFILILESISTSRILLNF